MLLREKKCNIVLENFKRKQIIGCNISNLGLKTFSCEHSVTGRQPSCCIVLGINQPRYEVLFFVK